MAWPPGSRAPRAGLAFGLSVWAASLVELPVMQLSAPVWEQPPGSIAVDAGFHVAYGPAVAAAYEALS